MVEGRRLESVRARDGTVGSNPTRSASLFQTLFQAAGPIQMPVLKTTVSGNKAFLDVSPTPTGRQHQGKKSRGLIDTGATISAIGSNIWRAAGLTHKSGEYKEVEGYDGRPEQRKLLWCDLHLSDSHSNTVILKKLQVIGGDPNKPDDVVIGMDVLTKCVLTLDGPASTMTLDFP